MASVILALALAYAPEIKTERRDAFKRRGFCRAKNRFRVHGSTELRMRVANHGAMPRSSFVIVLKQRLKQAGGAWNKERFDSRRSLLPKLLWYPLSEPSHRVARGPAREPSAIIGVRRIKSKRHE